MYRSLRRLFLLLPAALLTLQVACDEPSEIRQYRIAKSRSDLGNIGTGDLNPANASASSGETTASSPVPTRMVVAIAERNDATWFFKLTGPVAAVNEIENQWTELFSAIDFDDSGKPQWGTVDGWELAAAKPMRFATLTRNVENKGQVELAISSLGPKQDLLLNVNRWLGQLGQPAIKQEELNLQELDSAGGKLKLFDETGEMAGSGMSSAPAMRPPIEPEPDFAFAVPDGWEEGLTNSIVKVRLRKGNEETSPQITVTQLLAAANQWTPNAQRWARQADMDDSESFVDEQSTELSVDGNEGNKIRLIPEDETKPYGLIGVMVVRDELAWFFKLIGDRKQIVACESDFDEFINSFRFEKAN